MMFRKFSSIQSEAKPLGRRLRLFFRTGVRSYQTTRPAVREGPRPRAWLRSSSSLSRTTWCQCQPNSVKGSSDRKVERCEGKYTRMSDELYEYMLDLMPMGEALSEVNDYTSSVPAGHMQSSPEQIKLFKLLIKLLGAKKAIEVGVFTGYSALGIAQALPEEGVLYAFERDEEVLQVAKSFWNAAGVGHKIKGVLGDAAEELQKLVDVNEGEEREVFDFAFIDANKRAQEKYFEQCLHLVRRGGLIVVDNVLWYGRVVDGERNDKITHSIRALNESLKDDPRIDLTVLPVGDGIAICHVV